MARARRPSPQTAAVLTALAETGAGWSHGYDLCRALGLKAGTVYPILIRLTERGQVETSQEADQPRGRPARHLYRLTAAGAELARTVAASARAGEGAPALGAVRDVLRPEFLVGMIVFWTTGTAGGAAVGAALGRLRTSAPDDLATPTAR